MTIDEYIAQVGVQGAFDYMVSKPGCALLLRAMPTPGHIEEGLKRLGIITTEQFDNLLRRIHTELPFHRILADMIRPVPAFPLTATAKLPFNPTIHALINQQYDTSMVTPDRFWHSDLKNSLLPKDELDWLATKNPALGYQWNSGDEARDCDNSVRLTLGWLASLGLEDLAAGAVTTLHYNDEKLVYAHAQVFVVDDQQRVWQWDTMAGGLHGPDNCNVGNFSSQRANRLKVYRVSF